MRAFESIFAQTSGKYGVGIKLPEDFVRMDHDTLALIERAVQTKRVCRASFEEEEGARTIHPYGIFRTKKGVFMIACWQEGSYNELEDKPLTPGFRNFPLNSCEWIEVTDRIFIVNMQFKPDANIYNEWVYHV